jgi:hypothetical protein
MLLSIAGFPSKGFSLCCLGSRERQWKKYKKHFKITPKISNIPRNIGGIFVRQLAMLE